MHDASERDLNEILLPMVGALLLAMLAMDVFFTVFFPGGRGGPANLMAESGTVGCSAQPGRAATARPGTGRALRRDSPHGGHRTFMNRDNGHSLWISRSTR